MPTCCLRESRSLSEQILGSKCRQDRGYAQRWGVAGCHPASPFRGAGRLGKQLLLDTEPGSLETEGKSQLWPPPPPHPNSGRKGPWGRCW